MAIVSLLVAAPLSSADILGGVTNLNAGGRSASVIGGSGVGNLGGTVSKLTDTVGTLTSGATGTGGATTGALSGVTSTLTGATGGTGGAGGTVAGLTDTVASLTGAGGLSAVTNAVNGVAGTVTSIVGDVLSAAGLSGLGVLGAPSAGYQPPLQDVGNPHGQGTVATATIGPNLIPGLAGTGDVVVGRSLGEYQTLNKVFHGHITILSLFGSEILGVDSTPNQPSSTTGINGPGSVLGKICAASQQICVNVLAATSTTTNTSSINHFEAAGVGVPGVVSADAAYSDGNISVDPVSGCETTFGGSHAANVDLGAFSAAGAVDSVSGSTSCNDATKNVAPNSLSQVIGLLGTPLGLPIVAPNPGCSSGGPASTFGTHTSGVANTDAGIPGLLDVICNAADTNGQPSGTAQDKIPYTVREGLTALALNILPTTALAKVTVGASQASSTAPGTIGTTTATTTTAGTTTATTTTAGTTTATTTTAGTTTATTTTAGTTTATTTTAGTTTATTTTAGTTTTTAGTTTSPPATTTGTPGTGNNSTSNSTGTTAGTTAGSTGTTGTTGSTGSTTGTAKNAATLPFTGLNVLWLLLGGVTMLAAGTTLRRFGSRRPPAE